MFLFHMIEAKLFDLILLVLFYIFRKDIKEYIWDLLRDALRESLSEIHLSWTGISFKGQTKEETDESINQVLNGVWHSQRDAIVIAAALTVFLITLRMYVMNASQKVALVTVSITVPILAVCLLEDNAPWFGFAVFIAVLISLVRTTPDYFIQFMVDETANVFNRFFITLGFFSLFYFLLGNLRYATLYVALIALFDSPWSQEAGRVRHMICTVAHSGVLAYFFFMQALYGKQTDYISWFVICLSVAASVLYLCNAECRIWSRTWALGVYTALGMILVALWTVSAVTSKDDDNELFTKMYCNIVYNPFDNWFQAVVFWPLALWDILMVVLHDIVFSLHIQAMTRTPDHDSRTIWSTYRRQILVVFSFVFGACIVCILFPLTRFDGQRCTFVALGEDLCDSSMYPWIPKNYSNNECQNIAYSQENECECAAIFCSANCHAQEHHCLYPNGAVFRKCTGKKWGGDPTPGNQTKGLIQTLGLIGSGDETKGHSAPSQAIATLDEPPLSVETTGAGLTHYSVGTTEGTVLSRWWLLYEIGSLVLNGLVTPNCE